MGKEPFRQKWAVIYLTGGGRGRYLGPSWPPDLPLLWTCDAHYRDGSCTAFEVFIPKSELSIHGAGTGAAGVPTL